MDYVVRSYSDIVGSHFCAAGKHVTILNERRAGASNVTVSECDVEHARSVVISQARLAMMPRALPQVWEGLQLAIVPQGSIVVEDASRRSGSRWFYTYLTHLKGCIIPSSLLKSFELKNGEWVVMKLTNSLGLTVLNKITNKDGQPVEEDLEGALNLALTEAREAVLREQGKVLKQKGFGPEIIMSLGYLLSSELKLGPVPLVELSTMLQEHALKMLKEQ